MQVHKLADYCITKLKDLGYNVSDGSPIMRQKNRLVCEGMGWEPLLLNLDFVQGLGQGHMA